MPDLSSTIGSGLASYYEKTAAELHKWVDPLSHEQFWHNPFPYGNTVGHLVLHLTGNLSYYIGARIAETGYIRSRDLEFTETQHPPKDIVLQKFDQTVGMVVVTIRKQNDADWMAAYSAEGEPVASNRFTIFLRCVGHAYHHVGQIIYLCRELAQQEGPPRR